MFKGISHAVGIIRQASRGVVEGKGKPPKSDRRMVGRTVERRFGFA